MKFRSTVLELLHADRDMAGRTYFNKCSASNTNAPNNNRLHHSLKAIKTFHLSRELMSKVGRMGMIVRPQFTVQLTSEHVRTTSLLTVFKTVRVRASCVQHKNVSFSLSDVSLRYLPSYAPDTRRTACRSS